MSLTISSQQLIATNLRYGSTAKSLKTLAFSDLAAKALFLSDKPLDIKEISKKVAELINVRSVSEDLIKNGLSELKNDGQITERSSKWELKKDSRNKIENEVKKNLSELDNVLNNHFPKTIDGEKLSGWFTDAITDFFVYNGDEWVQSVCKGLPKYLKNIKTTDELLDASIKKHGLSEYVNELKSSFRGFLSSDNIEDQRYLISVGFAMFSARLVAADVGADPIIIEELRNATFLVDTNFLFALQLDSHRFAASLEVEQALIAISARLVFIRETKEEYNRVWLGKKGEILKLVDVYPNEVVADTDDDFISTAVCRGCSDRESFETFFQSISTLPPQMKKELTISLLEDEKIDEEVRKAKNDNKLKTAIQKWYLKFKPFWRQSKSKSALEHDASLIYVADFERRAGNNVYILTLDRGLQVCCAERVGNHEIPHAVHLEGLVQILATNNAGPSLDATNYAPLLANILLKRCVPPEHMYSAQDLHWLYRTQQNIAKFNPVKIKEIALEVTKARLSGKSANDDKLQRTVNRLYQEEMQNTNVVVEESVERAHRAEEEAKLEKEKRVAIEKELNQKNKNEDLRLAKGRLIKALLWRIPVVLFMSIVVYILASIVLEALQKDNVLDFVISVCTFIGFGYKLLKLPIKEFLEFKKTRS